LGFENIFSNGLIIYLKVLNYLLFCELHVKPMKKSFKEPKSLKSIG